MRKILVNLIILIFFTNQSILSQYTYPFQDPSVDEEKRVENILSLMTLDEKIEALSTDPSVPRLKIKGCRHVEGLHGLSMGKIGNWGGNEPIPTTIFPQAIGLAETWDTSVMHLVGQVEGYDVRFVFQKYNRGGLVVRAPNADIGRDPRWGRTEECYGEDAWFNGIMAAAFIKGLQGPHPKYWLTASLMKHFLANSNENSRSYSSSDFDERLWREYYSLSFKKGVEAGSRCYMAAYNKINGIPGAVHPQINEITKKEWGVDGIICTDGGAYTLLVRAHKYYPDYNKAAAACIKSGINQFLDRYKEGVYGALANGYITEADIDSVLKGNYRVMIRLGLIDPPSMVPYSQIGISDTIEPWKTEKNKDIVRMVTRKSVVLLKNDKDILPLDKSKIKTIAVIGPRANVVLQDWYSGDPYYAVTPLRGIKNKVGKDIQVLYHPNNHSDSAVLAARKSDFVIVVVGNHPTGDAEWAKCPVPSDGKEDVDRLSLSLEQEDLIKQVYQANKNTIVVLISSFPFSIIWTKQNVPAIIKATHCSQELGNAIADVIFGDYNPAGRLVQTWPNSIDELPDLLDYNIRHGRTYMYYKGKPLFAFGYGLSYSKFYYSNLKINQPYLKHNDTITVYVDVKNISNRDGEEVVQLYISHINSKVERPQKELKAFNRVFIKAGETKTIGLTMMANDLAFWDSNKKSFVVERDKIKIMVGSSSDNLPLEKIIEVK